jgi:SNW domain-containing protein 1
VSHGTHGISRWGVIIKSEVYDLPFLVFDYWLLRLRSGTEVCQRSLMQQKLSQKEKAAKEENLRLLAQRAREERVGIASPRPSAETTGAMKSSLAAYGSDSGSASEGDESEEEEAAKVRDEMHAEKRREHER